MSTACLNIFDKDVIFWKPAYLCRMIQIILVTLAQSSKVCFTASEHTTPFIKKNRESISCTYLNSRIVFGEYWEINEGLFTNFRAKVIMNNSELAIIGTSRGISIPFIINQQWMRGTTRDLSNFLQSHCFTILGVTVILCATWLLIVFKLFDKTAIRVCTPHKKFTSRSDCTAMQLTCTNLSDLMLGQLFDMLWRWSINEVSKSKLSIHV